MEENPLIDPLEFSNPLEQKNIGLEHVQSFDELYQSIRQMKEIEGTLKTYTPDQLILIIERVRHGHRPIEFITRSYDIRDAVERLLQNDKIYLKYAKKN